MNSVVNKLMIIVNNDNSVVKIQNKAVSLSHEPSKKLWYYTERQTVR
jgi:hypothetical protein